MLSKHNSVSSKIMACIYFVKSNSIRYTYENAHLILITRHL